MSRIGETRNYKSGQKNNWRRTIWNEVLSRTNGREKTELILYLAGPQDLDRQIAVEKGVPTQNMVAIDFSSENVDRIRQQKVPALSADIHEVLKSWPASRPVCAVLLDFCSGLTTEGLDVYDVFEREPLRKAVVMVNFMRGRDAFTNAIRASLTDVEEYPMAPCHMVGGEETFSLSDKHRALQFMVLHAIETWQAIAQHAGVKGAFADEVTGEFDKDAWAKALACIGVGFTPESRGVLSDDRRDEYLRSLWFVFSNMVFKAMRPAFFSYKSGVLTFDSVVFQHVARGLDNCPPVVRKAINSKFPSIPDVARKISACLAVRTMRQ